MGFSNRSKSRPRVIVVLVLVTMLVVVFAVVRTDRTILGLDESESLALAQFRTLESSSTLKIAPESESGQRLLLCLTFVDKLTNQVLQNQKVHFYHATENGEYEPRDPADETTARLSGQAVTNAEGHIFAETILPGDYGSSADNRHIHTVVFGAKPEAYDIHFRQFSTFMLRRFIQRSDQHFLADVKRAGSGEFVSFLTIEPKF